MGTIPGLWLVYAGPKSIIYIYIYTIVYYINMSYVYDHKTLPLARPWNRQVGSSDKVHSSPAHWTYWRPKRGPPTTETPARTYRGQQIQGIWHFSKNADHG